MRKLLLLHIWIVLVILSSMDLMAQESRALSLFDQSVAAKTDIQPAKDELRRTTIQINPEIFEPEQIMRGDEIRIDLFGEEMTMMAHRVSENVNGTISIAGSLSSGTMDFVIITITDQRLSATVELSSENRNFRILSDPVREIFYKAEMDPAKFAPLECGGVITVDDHLD